MVAIAASQHAMNLCPDKLKLSLEDLLADLWHARRSGDVGRLALLSYYEVRRWARLAGDTRLAEHSSVLVTGCPYADRESFLADADRLIAELEAALRGLSPRAWSAADPVGSAAPAGLALRTAAVSEARH
jgi:hypothetical protein